MESQVKISKESISETVEDVMQCLSGLGARGVLRCVRQLFLLSLSS